MIKVGQAMKIEGWVCGLSDALALMGLVREDLPLSSKMRARAVCVHLAESAGSEICSPMVTEYCRIELHMWFSDLSKESM